MNIVEEMLDRIKLQGYKFELRFNIELRCRDKEQDNKSYNSEVQKQVQINSG